MVTNSVTPASLDVNEKDKLDLLPYLKGAAISILLALQFSRKPMSNRKLQKATDYSDKSISLGLEKLKDKGVVRRSQGGWILAFDFFETGYMPTKDSELFRTDGNSSSTTTDINNVNQFNDSIVVDSRKNSAYQALRDAGIYDPKASDLVELKYVTEEFVKAHAEYGKLANNGIGLIINRIEKGEPVPNINTISWKKTGNPKGPERGKAVEDKVSEVFGLGKDR
jgi:hypothetical protein